MKVNKVIIISIFLILLFNITYADDALKKAEDALKRQDFINAKEVFQKYTEDLKLSDRALIGLAKAEYFLGNYYEATTPLRRLLREFKDSPYINEANLYMGLSYLKIGRFSEAEYYLKKVEPLLQKQAIAGIGWIALNKGDLKLLEEILTKFDQKDFNEPDTALLRIKYLSLTGKTEQALVEFNKNPKLKKNPHYDIDRAEVLMKAMRLSDAEVLLKKIIERSKNQRDILKAKKLLFEVYLTQQRTEEALKIGKEIYFYTPNDEIRLKIYSIYMNEKNYNEALKTLFVLRNKEVKEKKTEEFIKTVIGESPEKAVSYILKAYPFLPEDSLVLLDSARFLISKGRYNEAKILLRKAQTGLRRTEAVTAYCKILINEGKYAEAKKILEPMKDKNDMAKALYAQILYKKGDTALALSYLRRISKLNDPDILNLAGDIEFSDGDRKKAIQFWISASKLGSAEGALKSADYFYLIKNTKQATEYYKTAMQLGLKDEKTLMWAYYQYGKLTNDKAYLEKVANSNTELSEAAKALLEKP